MKKRYILLILVILLLCGCKSINNKSIDEVINGFNDKVNSQNVIRTAYKYYLPSSLNVKEYYLYNDVIESSSNIYYLYADVVSYYNKVEKAYEENNTSFYSKRLSYNDKSGYLEINEKENNQYLIEIMYNYAKIEVMVDKDDINLALNFCILILNSIEYSDNVISNLIGDDVLNFEEKDYKIFTTTSQDSSYIKILEEDTYEENVVKDTDLLN